MAIQIKPRRLLKTMKVLSSVGAAALRLGLLAGLACTLTACALLKAPRSGSSGLKPGINYMQPKKWRVTYDYRVSAIEPNLKLHKGGYAAFDSSIPVVGKGTFEVWMVGPRQGDELRDVRLVSASMEPELKTDPESETEFCYFNFAPDGKLPQEIHVQLSWELISFERYTFWDGLEKAPYDKTSALYKKYTKEQHPFIFHHSLVKAAAEAVKAIDPLDYQARAAACYNLLIGNMTYDFEQDLWVAMSGQEGMSDAMRAWENRTGQCDEFTNVYVTMLRSIGIPARPVAGFVHLIDSSQRLESGGHAWAEYYLPNAGWVPVDPTWGGNTEVIDMLYSPMGNKREIPTVDYYYGKSDPYRLTLFKNWNYLLQPPPKTPKAKKNEMWFVGATHRFSGVRELVPGFQGPFGYITEGLGEIPGYRTAGPCLDVRIELLGPADKASVDRAVQEIEAEGSNYVNVPPVPGEYPIQTAGR